MMSKNLTLHATFFCFLLLTIGFWFHARDLRAVWANVPPAPSMDKALSFSLGDKELAYRSFAIMLQNIGDSGGKTVNLSYYNYDRLGQWFFLEDKLNKISDVIPLIAAFYYGATPDPDSLNPVVDYLSHVGAREEGEKWRWLAQAVYLKRFVQDDLDEALKLAYKLANHPNQDRPGWTYQMPAFVLNDIGDKEAAYKVLMGILVEEAENLHPTELNFTKEYICERVLTDEQREKDPLCSGKAL
jgi:hypothetical protein